MPPTTEHLDRLVAFDTLSQRPTLELIDFVQDYLAGRGFALTRFDDPGGEKAGLLASIGTGASCSRRIQTRSRPKGRTGAARHSA